MNVATTPLMTPTSTWRRRIRTALVVTFVCGNLLFMAIRNPFDFWDRDIYRWIEEQGWSKGPVAVIKLTDRFTNRYANGVGCEQRWVMFRPPMARGATFLAFRFEFADGTSELVRSPNEPNPARYFRIGGWQIRKYEDYLAWPPDDIGSDQEVLLWQAYLRGVIRRWREQHPQDERTLARIVLIQRRLEFTTPSDLPGAYPPPTETSSIAFSPEGRLLP